MNVAAVSATLGQRHQDFDALQSALQTGNITSAQSAFAAFLQDVQKTALTAGPNSLFAPGTQTSHDLQALGNALKSANLTGAQTAFASLKQDIQTMGLSASGQPVTYIHHRQSHADIAGNQVGTIASDPASIGSILNLQA